MLKKLLVAAAVMLAAFSAKAEFGVGEYTPGQITVGARTGFTSGSFMLGLDGTYAINKTFRLAGDAEWTPASGSDAVNLDVNLEMPLVFSEVEKLTLYPIGGIDVRFVHVKAAGDSPSHSDTYLGLNIGAGAEWAFKPNFCVFAEDKGVFGSSVFTQFAVGARLKF